MAVNAIHHQQKLVGNLILLSNIAGGYRVDTNEKQKTDAVLS